jgi:hypothetical protein
MAVATTDSTIILGLITGKASGSIVGDLPLLVSLKGNNIVGVNSSDLLCNDDVNSQTLAHGGFTATQYVVALLQTDISESKKRLGLWSSGTITWASWATFDLSFDVAAYLDALVNTETMTLSGLAIYSALLSDADIKIEITALKALGWDGKILGLGKDGPPLGKFLGLTRAQIARII